MEEFKNNYTVVELRDLCRSLNLSTSGVKDVLVSRIFDYFAEMRPTIAAEPILISQQPSTSSQPIKSSRMVLTSIVKRLIPSRSRIFSFKSLADSSNLVSNIVGANSQINSLLHYSNRVFQLAVPCFALFGGAHALYCLFMAYFGTEKIEATIEKRFWTL